MGEKQLDAKEPQENATSEDDSVKEKDSTWEEMSIVTEKPDIEEAAATISMEKQETEEQLPVEEPIEEEVIPADVEETTENAPAATTEEKSDSEEELTIEAQADNEKEEDGNDVPT